MITMPLQRKIKDDLKTAMMAKDQLQMTVIRGVISAVTNELISKGKSASDELPDEEVLTLLKRGVKQRKDAIEQYKKGNREDLAANEQAEIAVLEKYLPKTMSREEIKPIAIKTKEKLGISDRSKIGQFIGALMKELKGKADGSDVKIVAESLFD